MKGFAGLCSALFATGAVATSVLAAPISYQPTEAESEDVFIYQFISSYNTPPFNLPTGALNSDGYGQMLPTLVTGTGHDIRSLIRFDLDAAGITLAPDERAYLRLYVGDIGASGFGANPDPSASTNPTVSFYLNTSPFNENETTWSTRPSTEVTPIASVVIDDIYKWISVDITDAVQFWLDNPSSNFGLTIMQDALVTREGAGKVGVMFESSATENGPILAVVPEPSSAAIIGITMLAAATRRRRVR